MTDPQSPKDSSGRTRSEHRWERQHLEFGSAGWLQRLSAKTYSFLDVIGDARILGRSQTAVFCSSKCSGSAIRTSTRWMAEVAEDPNTTLIGGFHSAVEKILLEILLDGKCQLVICPARSLERFRIPAPYRTPIESGRLIVVSSLPQTVRSNSASSSRHRNQFVADMADQIVVAHAAEGSRTEQFALDLLRTGRQVHCLAVGCESLISAGAIVFPAGETDERTLE